MTAITTATMTSDQLTTLTALADTTNTKGAGNSDALTAPVTSCLEYELHNSGGIYIPAQVAQQVPRCLFESQALNIHRAQLEATAPGGPEDSYYMEHTLTPEQVRQSVTYTLMHDQPTNTASALYTVKEPMYLMGETITDYLKLVHRMITGMNELESMTRPVNVAGHLLEAASAIEEYSFQFTGDLATAVPLAADLFAHYLVIFSARECQEDYTPIEYLQDACIAEDDYKDLEEAGLISPMLEPQTGKVMSYLLTLFAGE